MARRYTYAASLSWGGDVPTAELEVEVSYEVAWDYEADHLVEDIRVEKIEGQPAADYVRGEYMLGHTVDAIVSKLEMDREADMLAHASEIEAADHIEAIERRAEYREEAARG